MRIKKIQRRTTVPQRSRSKLKRRRPRPPSPPPVHQFGVLSTPQGATVKDKAVVDGDPQTTW